MQVNIFAGGQFRNLNLITIAKIISAVVILVMIVASLSFVFSLLIGGVRWILSGGKKEATDQAKAQILNALVGILVVFSAWAVINFLSLFFGIELLTFDIPTIQP